MSLRMLGFRCYVTQATQKVIGLHFSIRVFTSVLLGVRYNPRFRIARHVELLPTRRH
jgi:hypothetical protein